MRTVDTVWAFRLYSELRVGCSTHPGVPSEIGTSGLFRGAASSIIARIAAGDAGKSLRDASASGLAPCPLVARH